MITILLVAIIFTIAILWDEFPKWDEAFLVFLLGLIVGAVASIFIGFFFETEKVINENIPLYAIKDNSGTSGRFFIGSGSIETEPYYFYLVKEGDGFSQKSTPADKVIIVETFENPRVETYKPEFVNKNRYLWGIPFTSYKDAIFVPPNTIKYSNVIDLE